MPFNRINGFYVGKWSLQEPEFMSLDERNNQANEALEARFSQLNAAFEEHEASLKAMMVPMDVWVVYRSCADQEHPSADVVGEYQWLIGMIKLKGTWRLCHGYYYEDYRGSPNDDYSWKPMVEASIEDRIRASAHIEKLREAIIASKEKLLPDLENAIATLAAGLAQSKRGES